METHESALVIRSTVPASTHRRIVLFPLPFVGHINPMLQLANILHNQGFAITIIHTEHNSPNHSNYPHFTFKPISDRFSEIKQESLTNANGTFIIRYLNDNCVDPFKICLAGLLVESNEDPIVCLITDAMFYFTQTVADSLKIPRMVLWVSSIASVIAYGLLPKFHEKGYFNLTKEDPNYETWVPEYSLMKVKDILKMALSLQGMGDIVAIAIKHTKASSGLIWNTFKELEESEFETIKQDFPVPSFTLGSFHMHLSAQSSSLIEQDKTILLWLDTLTPKSMIYASFGSVALLTGSELREVAYGLANTNLPFLWVVRPGVVPGSEWLESLPEKFLESVADRGRIVKWAPQQEILAHPATGCFLTHSGWNSTIESIYEGVPMVCSPVFCDQQITARYVSDVWKVGVLLEDGLERVKIEVALKKVMMDKEREEMHKRIICLKEKVNRSLEEGGSSRRSLKSLVDYISSF